MTPRGPTLPRTLFPLLFVRRPPSLRTEFLAEACFPPLPPAHANVTSRGGRTSRHSHSDFPLRPNRSNLSGSSNVNLLCGLCAQWRADQASKKRVAPLFCMLMGDRTGNLFMTLCILAYRVKFDLARSETVPTCSFRHTFYPVCRRHACRMLTPARRRQNSPR
jgi:hypothetical protein